MSAATVRIRAIRAHWARGRLFAPGEVYAADLLMAADIVAGGRGTYAEDAEAAAELVRAAVQADAIRVVNSQRATARQAARVGHF